jgi:23S rRNA (adenine2503-C2)-methyltransferase
MKVLGRKVALNFAVSEYPIEGDVLARYFDPSKFMCKITPMHKTCAAEAKGIRTHGGYDSYYPYETVEADLKKHGYDVLVFVPSLEEDLGRITCGNAILSGSRPEIPHNRTDYQPLRGDSR